MALVLMKVGGSLLDWSEFPARLTTLIQSRPGDLCALVLGGGDAADAVRSWSRIHNLNEESAHQIAIRSLSVTRALARSLMSRCEEISRREQLHDANAAGGLALVDVEAALEELKSEPLIQELPHTWDVTSDSLAAVLAACWCAEELVLVKSTDLNAGMTVEAARDAGLVDAYFPRISSRLPRVCWCNLRSPVPAIQSWLSGSRGWSGPDVSGPRVPASGAAPGSATDTESDSPSRSDDWA